ncbi:hypothetical protein [Marinobacter adhaerens]|uniref:hypothetical protein n=1 Tax=Marinobacter adhaerens TaxID=1033846 RepID=UPI003F70C00F
MTEKRGDIIIVAVIFALFGFLLGVSFSDIKTTASDFSSIFIAVAAVYGVVKWRAQHDYQMEKEDQRQIIKLIKKCSSYCLEWQVSQSMLSVNIEDYVKNKDQISVTERNKWIVKKGLERVENYRNRLSEICCEIESEAATNSVVKKSKALHFRLHCMLHRADECISTANSTISVMQSFESIEHDTTGDFSEVKEVAVRDYKNFIFEVLDIEKLLGIEETSKAKSASYHVLQDVDKR